MNLNIDRREIFFTLGYVLWVICGSFLNLIGGNLYLFVKVAAIVFFAIAILQNSWYKMEIAQFLAFSILCFIVYVNSSEADFLLLTLLLLAFKGKDIYRVARIDFPFRVFGMCCAFICYFTHILSGNDVVLKTSFLGVRYSLGYYHPNNLFAQVFLVCVSILLTYHNKLKMRNYIELIILECLFGILTYSRTGMILLALLILAVALYSDRLESKKSLSVVVKYCFIICFFLTMLAVFLFSIGNSTISEIDALISGRFTYATRFIAQYGASLFGRNIEYISTYIQSATGVVPSVLDNLYAYLWVTGGIVFTLVFLFIVTKQQIILVKNHEYILAIVVFCYALYSITEKVYFSVNNNYILFLLTLGLTPQYKKKLSVDTLDVEKS